MCDAILSENVVDVLEMFEKARILVLKDYQTGLVKTSFEAYHWGWGLKPFKLFVLLKYFN
jgi:hypothetical protein